MFIDAFAGNVVGPLANAFGYSVVLSKAQPFRAITSGFFHSGIIHLLINMDTLRRQPNWLESGLGKSLYLSTFLLSIMAGNWMHTMQCANPYDSTLCLGASGGIAGLFGLMFASLTRMGSSRGAGQIIRGMAILMFTGIWLDDVSVASHMGGFFCGILLGILCGPRYVKDYSMRRKNSVEFDPLPREFRLAMGFGIMPTRGGLLPVSLIWLVLLIIGLSNPIFRQMPLVMWKKFIHPF
jgi:membrane associated rhomboid family serine protease